MNKTIAKSNIQIFFVISIIFITFHGAYSYHKELLFSDPYPADPAIYHELSRNLINHGKYGFFYEIKAGTYTRFNWLNWGPNRTEPADAQFFSTTYYAPGYPLLLAVIYKIFGYNYALTRFLNFFCYAISTFILWKVLKIFNHYSVRYILLFSLLFHPMLLMFAQAHLTENISLVLVTILYYLLILYHQHNRLQDIFLMGIVLGIMIVLRNVFLLWVPSLLLYLFFLISRNKNSKVKHLSVAICGIVVISAPWFVRNWIISEGRSPFSSQMGSVLWQSYDENSNALQGEASWQREAEFIKTVKSQNTNLAPDLIESKLITFGVNTAINNIMNNSLLFVKLSVMKFFNIWYKDYFSNTHHLILLGLFYIVSFLGLCANFKNFIFASVSVFIVMNALPFMLTHSIGYRAIIPILPILCMTFSLGAATLLKIITQQINKIL